MLDILFGWSKASKCKKVIKKARCRLKLLMNKRRAIMRQSREDVAELIKCGHQESAVNRVEHLIKDETLSAAYELLDHFCEFILTQLSYIRRHKDCPNDINEAVSSLIFASARIGNLPELFVLRKLFGRRYGQRFATTAVELLPGNLVNKQLIESLSLKSVPDDVKYRVVDEIARDHCLQPELLAIEYYPDWQQIQEREIKEYQVGEDGDPINARIAGAEMHDSEVEGLQREIVCVDSSIKKLLFKKNSSCFLRESNVADASTIISSVQKYLPYIQSFPLQKMEKVLKISELLPSPKDTRGLVAYGDDIEESQFSASRNGSLHDEKTRLDHDHQSDVDKMESESDKSSSRSSRKRSGSTHEKRTRRRSASLENQCVMDIGCLMYYHKPSRNASSHRTCSRYRLKHQKPSIEVSQAGYAHKRLKHDNSSEMERINACSLNHPCYCSVHDDNRDCLKALQVHPNTGITKPIWNNESNKGMELVSVPGRVVYNVFRYPDGMKSQRKENGKPEAYARAVTMPPERQRTGREKMVRMYSCPPEYPRHVHPKLPDYDDLAAKFIALKREHLHNKVINVDTSILKGQNRSHA